MTPFVRLYLEELRALPRGRFALAGAAVLAAILTFLAAVVGTAASGVWAFALVAYIMAPALFAGFAAAQMGGLRASRFTHSLFTAPVRKGEVLAAKTLVSLTVAALYLAASAPFLLVAALHVDLPAYVSAILLMGAGLLLFGTALGTLLGVLFTGRSSAPPVALAVAFMALGVSAVPLASALLEQPGGADPAVMRALHLSPHLLLADAVGLMTFDAGRASASPLLAGALVLLESAAMLGVAAWAYLREQGVEGWEAPLPRRALVAGLAALVALAPAAVADVGYVREEAADGPGRMAWSDSRNGTVALVRPGAPAEGAWFGDFFAGTFDDPLDAGRANERDLLVLLRLPEGTPLHDVRVGVAGRDGMAVAGPSERDLGDVLQPERGALDAERGGPLGPRLDGPGPVVRVPVTLTPADPHDLNGNWYPMRVLLTYRLANQTEPTTVEIAFPVRADVPGAEAHMVLAGSPLVLLLATASVLRRVRVG